jgi:membrane peptidoglycan carboxypeptidase
MRLLRPADIISIARRVVVMTGVSGLAGLLVAGLALPVAGGIGLTAQRGVNAFNELPSDLAAKPLSQRSRVVDEAGKTLGTFYDQNRVYVPLDKIAPVMQQATLAIEDHRFYEHGPIDLHGTTRALIGNIEAGETTSGGSTLTQQYVKLVLLEQAETDEERVDVLADSGIDGYKRKLRELRLATEVENKLGKSEILERYLNIANFGGPPGRANYGVQAAAQYYFSTPAADLNLVQAATLAGLVQRPTSYDPTRNPESAIGRRNTVLTRMAEVGMITNGEAAAARQADLGLDITDTRSGCLTTWAPWFCDYVVAEVRQMVELGDTPEERENQLLTGGLAITTTLDPKVQHAADDAVSDMVAPTDSAIATIAMVEPGTGNIKAISNSRTYGTSGPGASMINYAANFEMGNSRGIQAGSVFKIYILAAAIRQGKSLNTRINAPDQIRMGGKRWGACEYEGQSFVQAESDWSPKNSTRGGTITLRQATEWSTNTYFIQMSQRTGLCEPATIAESTGVSHAMGNRLKQVPSFTLGANEVAPLDVAGSLAMFANRGVYCEPRAIQEVRDRDGNVIVEDQPTCERVLEEHVADGVNDVLRGVIETPGATGSRMRLSGHQAAGKTGTTNDNIAVWFAGYTPNLAAVSAVADVDPPQRSLNGRTYNGSYMGVAFGGTLPGPIWRNAMNTALEDEPAPRFNRPSASKVKGINRAVSKPKSNDDDGDE